MLSRIKYILTKIIGSPDFFEFEFEGEFTVKELCGKIREDNLFIYQDNTIEKLNEFLKNTTFYKELFEKRKNIDLNKKTNKLINKIKSYGDKSFSELKYCQILNVKQLNRILLEQSYPKDCPKNPIKEFFLQEIVAHWHACRVERIITKNVKKLEKRKYSFPLDNEEDFNKLIEDIKECHKNERSRKEIIEDKAKASLFVISLSVTLLLGSLDFIKDPNSGIIFKIFMFLILVLGLSYFLLSGYSSIRAFNIRKFFDIDINELIKEKEGKLNIINLSDKDKISEMYKNIKINQLITNIRSNYVDATFIGIRNGIILISLFFIIVIVNIYFVNSLQHNRKIEIKIPQKSIKNIYIEQNKNQKEAVDKITEKMRFPLKKEGTKNNKRIKDK